MRPRMHILLVPKVKLIVTLAASMTTGSGARLRTGETAGAFRTLRARKQRERRQQEECDGADHVTFGGG